MNKEIDKSTFIPLTTKRKALTINLDQERYGTFAEIGAGQEVARWFFQVGGAAGTIVKSMSAYDMNFSDEIYGKSKRYVSRERLLQMMEHEFCLLKQRLTKKRGINTKFFVYANTVSARNFKGTNECHGWMGVRMQASPLQSFNDIIIHVRMLDTTNQLQQEAMGILGVNLVYGGFYYYKNPTQFIISLSDNLSSGRIEVDIIHFSGIIFQKVDNRVLSLKLVEHKLANAVMFGPDGSILQPSEVLYKKAVIVERGSFRPMTSVNLDMIKCAGSQFKKEKKVQNKNIIVLMEITMNTLKASGSIDYKDFLSRIDVLSSLGYSVLISNYFEFFRLSSYIRRYTEEMLGLVLGINTLMEIFNEKYYQSLDGGIMEATGRLFKENVRLYIYPMTISSYKRYAIMNRVEWDAIDHKVPKKTSDLLTASNLKVTRKLQSLYQYLTDNQYIVPVEGFNPICFEYNSRQTLRLIKEGNSFWESTVPVPVAKMIKEKNLWEYKRNNQ